MGEVLLLGEQIFQGMAGGRAIAKLAVGRGEHDVRPEDVRRVGFNGLVHGLTVVRLAVFVEAENQPIPTGMMGVPLHGPTNQGRAALPVAGEGDEKDGLIASVERVQGQGPLGGTQATRRLLAEEQHDSQSLMREVIGRGDVHGTPGGHQRPFE